MVVAASSTNRPKWTTVAKADGDIKYVICNADEGDPGAFMDRSVLESDPHRVLEGMALAAYAVGASEGYIYVRGEYPLAISRVSKLLSARHKSWDFSAAISATHRSTSHVKIRSVQVRLSVVRRQP